MNILSIVFAFTLILCFLALIGGAVLFALSKRHSTAHTLGILIAVIGLVGCGCSTVGLCVTDSEFDLHLPDWNTRIPEVIPQVSDVIPDIPQSSTPLPDEDGEYPAGTYLAGVDIPAGEYCLLAENDYATASVSDTEQYDYNRIAFFSTHRFATVEDGEYLIAENATFILADQLTPFASQPDGSYTEGEYRVGVELPEGEYYLTADGDYPRVELYEHSTLDYNDIEYSAEVNTFSFIEVENGEYLVLENLIAIPAKDAPLPAPLSDGSYAEGAYRIGIDIPAGTYYVKATDGGCYYEVCEEAGDDCEYNDFFETFTYVTLKEGEYFYLQRGSFRPEKDIQPATPDGDRYGPGVYRIGIDIPAGEYRITASTLTDAASAGIAEEMEGSSTDYEDYEYFRGSVTLSGKEGEYLEVEGATFTVK